MLAAVGSGPVKRQGIAERFPLCHCTFLIIITFSHIVKAAKINH